MFDLWYDRDMADRERPADPSLDRRGLFRATAALGAMAGVAALADAAHAARAQLPRAKLRGHLVPATISSELGTVVEGKIDLLTVRESGDRREGRSLEVEFLVDSLASEKNVRSLTDQIEQLALVNPELHRPETVLLTWGTGLAFQAVLTRFHTGYTMFRRDGTPVRATVATTWTVDESPAER